LRFQAVQGIGAALIVIGLAAVGWGYAEMAGSNPVLASWAGPVLVGVGGFLILSGLATLVVSALRGRGDDRGKDGEAETQIEVDAQHSPGAIVNPQAPITQYIGVEPRQEDSIAYWAGRPESLGPWFVGRDADLEAISEAFETRRAVVISGGAGSGKSRLAAEYAHKTGVPGFWTTAGSGIVETLAGLAGALGVRLAERTDEEIAGEVQRRLADLPPETLWAIDSLTDLEPVSELVNASGAVRLLITTRDSRRNLLPPTVAHRGIDVLEEDAAIGLLCSRSETASEHPELARIAEKVGRLPLALEVLAARLGEPRQTPESVLAQLDRAPTAIQMDAFRRSGGEGIPRADGVFAAIVGTLDGLDDADREALAGLAYVADAPVTEALACALTGLDDEGLTALLSACGRQSILSLADGLVRVHALTVAALAATNPDGELGAVLARTHSRLTLIAQDDPVALRAELVHYEALHSQARDRLGTDEESVLSLGNSLAIGHSTAGRIQEAIELDELTLEVRERVLGPEHPDTLANRSNLAVGYLDAGRVDDAIRLDEQTLDVRERVLGPEHPSTLASRNNLAGGYLAAGRNEDSIRLNEQTQELKERVLGPEHPDTLKGRINLAEGYRAARRIQDAIRLDEQTLEVQKSVLGPEHPSTLTSYNNLAAGYGDAGRFEEAIELFERTLEIRERVLGPEHPDALMTRSNLARGYRDAGRPEDAIELDEQTLEVRERVLGPEHPDTLGSRSNLARGYRAAGRVEDARRLEARQ
jgi:pentatricopeptide repeat protein